MNCSIQNRIIVELQNKGLMIADTRGELRLKSGSQSLSDVRKYTNDLTAKLNDELKNSLSQKDHNDVSKILKRPYGKNGLFYVDKEGKFVFNFDSMNEVDKHLDVHSSNIPISSDIIKDITQNTLIDSLAINPKWDEYIQLRKFDILKLEKIEANIVFKLKDNRIGVNERKALYNKLNKITATLDALNNQYDLLKKNQAVSVILLNAELDFMRIEEYINGEVYQDYNDILSLVDFYIKIAERKDNPLFDLSSVLTTDGRLQEDYDKFFEHYIIPIRNIAEELKAKIEVKRREAAMAMIVNHPNFDTIFKDLTFKEKEEMLYHTKGLPDTSLIDTYVMDITGGITSTNGMIPQIMQLKLDASMSKYNLYVRELTQELDEVSEAIQEFFSSMPKDMLPDGIDNPWNIFYEFTPEGFKRDSIISPYTQEYYKDLGNILRAFKKDLQNLRTNNASYKQIGELYKAYRGLLSEIVTVFDPNKSIDVEEALSDLSDEQWKSLVTAGRAGGALQFSEGEKQKYKEELIKKVGQFAYDQMVEDQVKKVRNYIERLDAMKADPKVSEDSIKFFVLHNNPFRGAELFEPSSTSNSIFEFSNLVFIPNKEVTQLGVNNEMETFESGYYNSTFSYIESHKPLMDFYKVLSKYQSIIYDLLPPDMQMKMGTMTLLSMEKSFWEVAWDSELPILLRLSKLFSELWERMVNMFSINVSQRQATTYRDPITGEMKYRVSDRWFQTNKSKIQDIISEETIIIKQALGLPDIEWLFRREDIYDISENKVVIQRLADLMGVLPTRASLERKLGYSLDSVPMRDLLKDVVTDYVMREQSADLPKMLRMQLHQAATYAARTEALPQLEILKQQYEAIRDEKGEVRKNSIRQMESWFNRVVLDGYEDKNEFKKDDIENPGKPISEKWLPRAYRDRVEELNGVLELLQQRYNDAVAQLSYNYDQEVAEIANRLESMITRTEEEIDSYSRNFSTTKLLSSILHFIRFKGLGLNLNSGITNFVEGQLSNFNAGQHGIYFDEEQLARANRIVGATPVSDVMTLINNTKVAGAAKANLFMKRFDVLQDASNELQKASKEATVDKSWSSAVKDFNPYIITQKVEYMNQSPIMVAIMLNTPITGIEGKTTNLWDAFDDSGRLLDEYRTQENIDTWENMSTEEFASFRSHISKVIINLHGDYHDTHGNLASEYMTGKSMMMFKRWLPRMVQRYLGREQVDLETKQTIKGQYRSFDLSTGLLYGLGIGALISPATMLLTGTIGAFYGGAFGIHTGNSVLKDLSQNLQALALNIIRFPVNALSQHVVIKSKKLSYDGEVSHIDRANIKANLGNIAIMFWFLGIQLVLKSALGNADDEDEERVLTYFVNKQQQFISQISMYLNPYEGYQQISDITLFKFSKEVVDFTVELQNYIEGDNHKLGNRSQKFIPSIFRDGLGFGATASGVFEKWGWDTIVESQDKRDKRLLRNSKEKAINELNGSGLEQDEVEYRMNILESIFRRREGETYEEARERIEQSEEDIENVISE